jgi:hypothetical protein
MAINYYKSISLSGEEIQDVGLEKVSGTLPSSGASVYEGRILFSQVNNTFTYRNNNSWVSLTGTGGVESVTGGDGITVSTTANVATISPTYSGVGNIVTFSQGTTAVSLSDKMIFCKSGQNTVQEFTLQDLETLFTTTGGVNQIVIGTPVAAQSQGQPLKIGLSSSVVTITPQIYNGTSKVGYVPSSAALGSTYFLRGDGTWVVPDNDPGVWILGDGTSTQNVSNGTTINFAGGVGISTASIQISTNKKLIASLALTDSALQVADAGTLDTDSLAYSTYDSSNNQKAEISDAPLNVLGDAAGNIAMGSFKITGLSTSLPSTSSDIVDKKFVDDSAGEVFNFQGQYTVSQNSPDLTTSPNSITKGQAWVVVGTTATFYGEQLRAGDFLIANDDDPSTLAMWEVVQANIGLATNSAFGIAYYTQANGFEASMTAGEPKLDAVANNVGSFGAADKSITLSTDEFGRVTDIAANDIVLPASAANIASDAGQISDFSTEVVSDISANSYANTYGGTSMTVNHDLGTRAVVVQARRIASPYDTIVFDVEHTDVNNVTLFSTTSLGANSVRVLVSKTIHVAP